MPPSRILDSHIHLWPSTALSPHDHAWMKDPTHLLSKRHGISDYEATTSSSSAGSSLAGFIYVETDRYLPSKTPDVYPNANEEQVKHALREWARAPLEELAFLRRVVEATPQEGDGFEDGQGEMMKGAVVWAPFHLSPSLFNVYLEIAEGTAGPRLWERVVGFRYLLQGKEDGEVKDLVGSEGWVENVVSLGKGRGGRGWAFDVGVDINRDGTKPLGAVGSMVREVREREGYNDSGALPVRFVLNHLCKHRLTVSSPTKPGTEWLEAIEKLGPDQNVFMKLSGAFNEFDSTTPSSGSELVTSLSPIVSKVFDAFGDRVMFGSDWPVCNVGGSVGERGNWGLWVECVEGLLKERKTTEVDRESVWWKAGSMAYDVQL